MFTLAFTRRYSMSHRLLSLYNGPCGVPHGHNELVTVRLQARHPEPLDGQANMVTPFHAAKKRWHAWIDERVDHTLQLSDQDPLLTYFREQEPSLLDRILVTPGDPSTEALAACFMAKVSTFLAEQGGDLRCVEVTIEETPTNTVTFEGDPDLVLPADRFPEPPWWKRPDGSINDL
ncbi:6-pyruvoyl trahydropterin synthase family protein [Thiohalorhabdus sp. Cl-TMA]|uniref:6-carboxy-5,6,7,8-tetrahydropterin synthase n=1 Tax=Thiohalorhabdus methylotrophus TaxID=3242694 RepID=A0ABV4TSE6_9GAMM